MSTDKNRSIYLMSSLYRSYECMNIVRVNIECRDRNWEVQAGSPDKIFDKKCLMFN